MNSDLEQRRRDLRDGLQTIIELAEGLKLDIEDYTNEASLQEAISAQDAEDAVNEDEEIQK